MFIFLQSRFATFDRQAVDFTETLKTAARRRLSTQPKPRVALFGSILELVLPAARRFKQIVHVPPAHFATDASAAVCCTCSTYEVRSYVMELSAKRSAKRRERFCQQARDF
jgi:hypothetical protein